MRTPFLLTIIITLIHLTITLSSGTEVDSVKTYHLQDSIVVIADRYEIPLKSIAHTIDLVPVKRYADAANHSVLQVVDLLTATAFVMDKKVLGYGVGTAGAGSINIRGMGGKPNSGILVLINGRPDFMAIFGHPLPDVYGLEDIDQIEIIKGPSSAVFGTNAMGGVINLVSETPSQNALNFKMMGGNFNTFKQRFGMDFHSPNSQLRLNFTHQQSDGHVDLTGFNGWNMSTQFTRKLAQNWKFTLSGRYVPYQFDDPSMGRDAAGLGVYGKIRRGMADAQITGKMGNLNGSYHLFTNLGHHRFFDGFESHDFSYGLSTYQHLNFSGKLQIGFGAEALHYGGRARSIVAPAGPPAPILHTINSMAGYVVGFYTPTPRFTIEGGFRYQHASIDVGQTSPTAGLSYLPSSHLKLFANYNHGFRFPTLQELYLFPSSDDNLQPENIQSAETGIEFYFDNRNYLKFSYFRNNVTQLIQLAANPGKQPPYRYQNSGKAQQWGFETGLYLQPFPFMKTQLMYSYLEPDNLTAYNPAHMFKYYLATEWRKFEFAVFGKYIAGIYAQNSRLDKLDNYALLNFSLTYPVRYATLHLQVQNVLNTYYEFLPGYGAPPLNFLAGFSLDLPR